jgi:5-methylcytosine-specific restriction endonuclease McrA
MAAPQPSSPARADCASSHRPIVKPLAPERYRVQFTIGQDSHDKLRRVQALLRREVPDGDPGLIFERALALLLEKVEKEKLGATARRRHSNSEVRPARAYENRIRPGTDKGSGRSRHIPNEVKRAVWYRDGGQCAFVSDTGRRCMERSFLELHHVQPYALDGPATVGNIALRCRRHNHYESEMVFGARTANGARPG